MPRRSTKITLKNNTDFMLTLIGKAGPCHGIWTDGLEPPPKIPQKHRAHGSLSQVVIFL